MIWLIHLCFFYLHQNSQVTSVLCKENKNLTCGTLRKAFSKDGKEIKNYEHKGKYVVWDMKKDGDNNFSGGKIKDYSDGKVYNSKMEILTEKKKNFPLRRSIKN